jgi:hypothetical protein
VKIRRKLEDLVNALNHSDFGNGFKTASKSLKENNYRVGDITIGNVRTPLGQMLSDQGRKDIIDLLSSQGHGKKITKQLLGILHDNADVIFKFIDCLTKNNLDVLGDDRYKAYEEIDAPNCLGYDAEGLLDLTTSDRYFMQIPFWVGLFSNREAFIFEQPDKNVWHVKRINNDNPNTQPKYKILVFTPDDKGKLTEVLSVNTEKSHIKHTGLKIAKLKKQSRYWGLLDDIINALKSE